MKKDELIAIYSIIIRELKLISKDNTYEDDFNENAIVESIERIGIEFSVEMEEWFLSATNKERHEQYLTIIQDEIYFRIGKIFSHLLLNELGKKKFNEMVKLHISKNAIKEQFCVTHDFIDANMIMDEAIYQFYGQKPSNYLPEMPDYLESAWNNAWYSAKQNNFKY